MGNEDGARLNLRDKVLQYGLRNCLTIERACSTAELIKDDQRAVAGELQDLGSLGHFDHESGSASSDLIRRAHSRED